MNPDDDNNGFPFPIPISPAMPMSQQMSMSSLYPGMNTQPTAGPSYNFAEPLSGQPQYNRGGHVGLRHLAQQLQSHGEGEDEILAFINPEEAHELHQKFGSDINPHTGLPQFGFFKKFKKAIKRTGIGKILPLAGAIGGNYIAPGLGGIIGGGLGGAVGKKNSLKGALTGAGIGALQGYGLPYIGKMLSSSGMPQMGQALGHLGGSRFGAAYNAFSPMSGAALGKLSGARGTDQSLSKFERAMQGKNAYGSEEGGLGDNKLLDYILMGIAGAGMLGGKTKYEIPEEFKNEKSFQEMMKSMRPEEREEDKAHYIEPWKASNIEIPDIMDREYEYPEFIQRNARYKDGGHVNLKKKALKISKKGEGKDKILAHINTKEAKELDRKNGHDINPHTGLPQFGFIKKVFTHPKKAFSEVGSSVGNAVGSTASYATKKTKKGIASAANTVGHVAEKAVKIPEKALHEASKVPSLVEKGAKEIVKAPSAIGQVVEKAVKIPLKTISNVIPQKPPKQKFVDEGTASPEFMDQYISQNILKEDPYESVRRYMNNQNQSGEYDYPFEEKSGEWKKEQGIKYPDLYPQFKGYTHEYKPQDHWNQLALEIPEIIERGYPYPEFIQQPARYAQGGYIEGTDGGQDDTRPVKLPANGYVWNATIVSQLGDGNTNAGIKKIQEIEESLKKTHHYAAGAHVHANSPQQHIDALLSDGEYYSEPQIVSAFGRGDNKLGAKKLNKLVKNILSHKGIKGLPPKTKALSSYIKI